MITLKTSLLSENLGFNREDIQVKNVFNAWNKLREIRDTTPAKILENTVLSIEVTTEKEAAKIPTKILFKMNKNGKIEFKDFTKIKSKSTISRSAKDISRVLGMIMFG